MAVAQKAISRGVSEMETPTFDLSHCRSSSTSEISAIGVLQMKEANKTRSSKACSGSVSRIAYLWRAATRAASFFIGWGVAIVHLPRALFLVGGLGLITHISRSVHKISAIFRPPQLFEPLWR